MSKVISVLEKMASDAAINSESAIADLVAKSDINDGQAQAIEANDVEGLKRLTNGLPYIKSFIVIPAEDDTPEEDQDESSEEDNSESKLSIAI
jgi:hypothetical protein